MDVDLDVDVDVDVDVGSKEDVVVEAPVEFTTSTTGTRQVVKVSVKTGGKVP